MVILQESNNTVSSGRNEELIYILASRERERFCTESFIKAFDYKMVTWKDEKAVGYHKCV